MRARVAIVGAVCATALAVGVAPVQGDLVAATSSQLTYVKNNDIVWVADIDGKHPTRLGPGDQPLISPDSRQVAVALPNRNKGPALAIYEPGGPTHKFFNAAHVIATPVSWSPLGQFLAVELFSTSGNGAGLAIVNTMTHTVKMIAGGSICGASFAPDVPDRLAYAQSSAKSVCFDTAVNVFTAAADGSGRTQLTHDGRSLNPVWGAGTIAFDREKLRKNDAPIYQIWLMKPDGTGAVQLTHTKVPQLVEGLVPQQFSADGERLLADFQGQDTSQTWTIDIRTKKARHLLVKKLDVTPGGLSLDGKTVLIDFGGFENPPGAGTVETIPFAGGPAKVLVKHAGDPSWNL
jgi:hypothetical protein